MPTREASGQTSSHFWRSYSLPNSVLVLSSHMPLAEILCPEGSKVRKKRRISCDRADDVLLNSHSVAFSSVIGGLWSLHMLENPVALTEEFDTLKLSAL
jgi:hypothetical protein